MDDDALHDHYQRIVRAMLEGGVVPLLGAGANLCGRPANQRWERGKHLPSGAELAEFLAERFGFPSTEIADLARVAQFVDVMEGDGPLYRELHQLFDADYPPTALHAFLAELPSIRLERVGAPHYQLIVTTNYDDALERAFEAAGEPYDVVTYVAKRDHRGKFLHWPHGQEPRLIERPNEYTDIALDERTVILKIHGAIDRKNAERDSYVITEDHYIDYLTRTDISNLVPVTLAARLRNSHFLFLGYSMRDWNLRVILHRIWGEQQLSFKSWAIQLEPEKIEQKFWNKRDVEILRVSLDDYVENLRREVREAELPAGVGP